MSSNSLSTLSFGDVHDEDLRLKSPIHGLFKTLSPPRGDERMLDVCANLIADARARINGIDADKLISLCERCDLHGRIARSRVKQHGRLSHCHHCDVLYKYAGRLFTFGRVQHCAEI
jgi:hypothetical protein